MCKGRGEVIFQQAFLSVRRTCTQCNGRGQIIRRPCKECKAEGYLKREKKLKVTVPAGVDTGTQLRLANEGQPGLNGGPPGDLYVVLRVKPHPVFERRDDDLHCTVPINPAQAALGCQVEVNTLDGMQNVKVPEGSQPGTRLRLKQLGVPHVNGSGRGDLFVHLEVRIPTKLTKDQRKLFEQLRDTLPAENEPNQGIFDKVKDYFM
jgi:molecular chaperone DnaJ